NLTRTVLSTVNTAENPTALMAKREMQSWRVLRLEPAAMRRPDEITAPPKLATDGSHLAAMLFHLPKTARYAGNSSHDPLTSLDASTMLYARLSRRMREFIGDFREIAVDHDEKREILTVTCTGWDGTTHTARALADGALRFLALAAMELDTENPGVICLEEPENGIHPDCIPAMLSLLMDLAVDVEKPVGADNPLRQVIVNTHSPAIVARIPEESLLIAELVELISQGMKFKAARFGALPDTWRQNAEEKPATAVREKLAPYLPPVVEKEEPEQGEKERKREPAGQKGRPDQHPLLPFLIVSK
ncbi:MAG TPA: AAA family ATPase, partial [Desulfuromonadaceae bacterium]